MIRRIRQFAVLVSTLLMVGCVAVWVRSYWRADYVEYNTADGQWIVEWCSGVFVARTNNLVFISRGVHLHSWNAEREDWRVNNGTIMGWLGFAIEVLIYQSGGLPTSGPNPGMNRTHQIFAPLWSLTLLFAILPTWTLIRYLCHRIPEGCCKTCGYDLRASKDRCPECGTAFSSSDTEMNHP